MTAESAARDRKRRPWVTVLGVLIALIIGLLLAEVLVRVADALGVVDLSPSLADLPASSQDEVVQLAGDSALYVSDPVLHHRMAANWSGAFPEEIVQEVGRSEVPIRTNSLGLRSPEVERTKPAGTTRILVLGDSVAFGWGVRSEDTFASQLASLLATVYPDRRFEVINAGVSGYGTWQELQWLKQTGVDLQPDVVIVQAHLNDAADNLWGTLGQDLGGGSWLTQVSMLARLVSRVAGNQSPATSAAEPCQRDWRIGTDEVCWASTEALLTQLKTVAQDAGAQVVLMPSPMRWQVEPGVRDQRSWVDKARYQDVLADYALLNGWLFADPLPAVRSAYQSSGQSQFLDVGHPDEAGQRVIAQELYRVLNQSNALP
ncbi:MAG: SGNH/GDSL hydrolase family protein [Caldilineales bacterium]